MHWSSVRAASLRFEDARVAPGQTYAYALRPYDLAGNHGEESATVTVRIPDDAPPADDDAAGHDAGAAADPGALEACVAVRR